jgi:hypothetical protein
MNPYLIFTLGVFAGMILGVAIVSLLRIAHDNDGPLDEAERWARLRQEMGEKQ